MIAGALDVPRPAVSAVECRAAILLLLGARGPTAILLAVRAVVVDAIKGVIRRWPWAHVGEERGEIVAPFVAHGDPTSAPLGVAQTLRVVAALFHGVPNAVFRRTRHAVSGLAVACASARPRRADRVCAPQKTGLNKRLASAITQAEVPLITAAVSRSRPRSADGDDGEFAESRAGRQLSEHSCTGACRAHSSMIHGTHRNGHEGAQP